MDFVFAPSLVDRVVRREFDRRDAGDPLVAEYRALLDASYLYTDEARRLAADRVHQLFFIKLGWADFFHAEFGEILPRVSAALVATAEGAEGCFVDAQKRLQVRLRAGRFEDRQALLGFLRHERMHAADILDPAFGYREEPIDEPTRHRYAALWCASIDERLKGQELEPVTHEGLLQRARSLARPKCPICAMPTARWAVPHPALAEWLRGQFPAWTPEGAICERCLEWAQITLESETGFNAKAPGREGAEKNGEDLGIREKETTELGLRT